MSFLPPFKIGIWNAWIFMSVFVLQMIIIMFSDKRTRERSHVPPEAKRNKFERYIGIIANIFWLLALGYSIFLPLLFGSMWFYTGLTVFIIGLIIMGIATVNFITTSPDQMITKGAYRLSRHPMYLATFFICLGSGIAGVSGLFIFISVIMALCFHQEALIEERYCLDNYREAYKVYMNSVPRWLGIPKKIE